MVQRINRYLPLVAITTVLLPLLFLFLHSELDLFTVMEEDHISHDYCEIAKNIIIKKSGISDSNLLNLKIIIPFYHHLLTDQVSINLDSFTLTCEDHRCSKKTTRIYLQTNTFLI